MRVLPSPWWRDDMGRNPAAGWTLEDRILAALDTDNENPTPMQREVRAIARTRESRLQREAEEVVEILMEGRDED